MAGILHALMGSVVPIISWKDGNRRKSFRPWNQSPISDIRPRPPEKKCHHINHEVVKG
jgi:hypothetical protein